MDSKCVLMVYVSCCSKRYVGLRRGKWKIHARTERFLMYASKCKDKGMIKCKKVTITQEVNTKMRNFDISRHLEL